MTQGWEEIGSHREREREKEGGRQGGANNVRRRSNSGGRGLTRS